jgi:sigma-B regulation protein RsbU (phosphoserine phosphatase)
MRSLFHSRTPESGAAVEPVPTVFPKIEGADIAAVFAGKRVAGDFYDSVRVSPERVLFGLLDVAGRRQDNRGILTAAQEIFRNFGTELFSRLDINESDAMTELSLRINRGLIESSSGVRPCPAFIACYHEKFGTLCYTNAGHTPGLLRDSRGTIELSSTGLPLGLFSHATCDAPTVGMENGAALLLVSRGVVECSGHHEKSAEEFGWNRVKGLLQAVPLSTAQALCTSILTAADQFSADVPLCDDRTALALVRTV